MVLEVASRSNDAKDFHDNLDLYRLLGIPEYVIVDTGEFSGASNMWVFRLDDTGNSFHMAERGNVIAACDTRLRVLDAPVAGNVPVFQCQDANGQWRDHEGDIAHKKSVDIHARLLDIHFPRLPQSDREFLVDAWTRDGVSDDMLQRITIAAEPNRGCELLGLKPDTGETGDSLPPGVM